MTGHLQDSYRIPVRRSHLGGLAKPGSLRGEAAKQRRELARELRSLPWFEAISEEELERLAAAARHFRFPPNWAMVRSGQVMDHCWLITEGSARILRDGVEAGEFVAGDTIGELEMYSRKASATTVVTATAVIGIAIEMGALREADLRAVKAATRGRATVGVTAPKLA